MKENKKDIPRATEVFKKWAHKNFKKGEGVMIWQSDYVFVCSRPRSAIYEKKKLTPL